MCRPSIPLVVLLVVACSIEGAPADVTETSGPQSTTAAATAAPPTSDSATTTTTASASAGPGTSEATTTASTGGPDSDSDSTSPGSTSPGSTSEAPGTDTASDSDSDSDSDSGESAPAIALITDENRHHETMFGGWGPHLRGIMRAPEDTLWFTVDAGPDVLTNQAIRYFRRDPDAWAEVASQPHTAGIQQNAASVMLGGTIYTYGVNIAQSFLEECRLNTDDLADRACNAVLISGNVYTTPPSSNYVGAAAHTDATRVVWFTRVGPGGAAGDWIYTYNFGGGWNGPVVTPVLGANDFAYVHASFVDAGTLALVGQLYFGKYPDGSYGAAVAELKLGELPTFVPLLSGEPGVAILSSSDLWVDPESGAQHVLARDDQGGVRYYFKPPGEPWAAHAEPLTTIGQTYRARLLRAPGGPLMIARGDAGIGSVLLLEAPTGDASLAVDWAAATSIPVPSPGPGFAPPSAIYVESEAYQTSPVKAVNLGFCGEYKVADHEIWGATLAAP